MAWRGVAWRGVAWRGVAWRGVAWLFFASSLDEFFVPPPIFSSRHPPEISSEPHPKGKLVRCTLGTPVENAVRKRGRGQEGGGVPISCLAVVRRPLTLALLKCQDGVARRVFTH